MYAQPGNSASSSASERVPRWRGRATVPAIDLLLQPLGLAGELPLAALPPAADGRRWRSGQPRACPSRRCTLMSGRSGWHARSRYARHGASGSVGTGAPAFVEALAGTAALAGIEGAPPMITGDLTVAPSARARCGRRRVSQRKRAWLRRSEGRGGSADPVVSSTGAADADPPARFGVREGPLSLAPPRAATTAARATSTPPASAAGSRRERAAPPTARASSSIEPNRIAGSGSRPVKSRAMTRRGHLLRSRARSPASWRRSHRHRSGHRSAARRRARARGSRACPRPRPCA